MTVSSKHNEVLTHVGPVERLSIGAISPPPQSLRKHTDRHKKQCGRCIEALGLITPIIIDSAGVIVAGLIWYLGALQLGLPELPVIRVTHLTPEKLQIYRIAEQRLSELAPWDDRAVAETFKELSQLDLGFSLEVTGFSQGEIDFRIENLEPLQAEASPDRADNIPAVLPTKISAVNDLWQVGRHRILCASALQAGSYSALMAGQRARAVITDPPFNVPIQGHVSGKRRICHREFVMASSEEFTGFLSGFFRRSTEHLTQGALLFMFMDWRHSAEILAAAAAVELKLKNICARVKSNAGMGSLYRSQHEFVFVFKYGKASHRNNAELGRHGRFRTNVCNIQDATVSNVVAKKATFLPPPNCKAGSVAC